jgi:CRP-like cAMP-binding protein
VARHDRHLDALRSLRLFSACTTKELEQIARLTDEVSVPAGHRIVTQGEPGREAFVIVDGTASVLLGDSPIADLGPGQHFGELALLDGGTRTANVDAVTDMTLLVIHRPAFMGLLDEQPGIARRVMATMASIIRDLESVPAG